MPRHTITGGGGLRLAVHEYGRPDGKAILLIHGFSQCHLSWVKQIQSALAEEFRLVCVDIRGHGMSEKPVAPENYTDADKWAADVHAILEGLALRKPILVGWSYGGFIINDYLARHGQGAIGGIDYVCAGAVLGVPKAAGTFGDDFVTAAPGVCSEDLEENIRTIRPFLHHVFEKQPTQDEFEVMLAFNMVVPPAVRLGLVSRAIDRDDVLRSLTLPVLVTEGEKDKVVLAAHTKHLLSCVRRAQHSVYPGVGHAPPFEEPERFNQELAAFARQHAG